MSRKFFTFVSGLAALAALVGAAFVFTSAASAGAASSQPQKAPGLTAQSIANAGGNGLPGALVTMAPQSSLGLLARATELGPHAPGATIGLTVALKLRNTAQLRQFLRQVQNPRSGVYRQWLTPAEFTRLYGPTQADVAKVRAFLEKQGITVTGVSSNRMLIHTSAPTARYEMALGLRINDYRLDGRSFYSTADSPKLPRALAPLVANVLGLNRGVLLHPISLFQRPLASARGLSPHATPAPSLTNLNPLQIAHAYNYPDITDAGNGAGVNVAILTANSSGLAGLSEPHDFWAAFGLPDHDINVIPVNGDKNDTSGMGETLLDVEYSGAMGPGATLNVYVAADPTLGTFITMYNEFANATNPDGTAKNQVMTTSWGAAETGWQSAALTASQAFMQAAAEGISMFAAAGDHGSGDGTDEDNVANYPSSDPFVASANGTQLNISDLSGTYGSEIVWNDANCFGHGPLLTGGAVSRLFSRPAWQQGPGVPSNIDMLMNSDMAATASCTKPMLVLAPGIVGPNWTLTAGTSAVAPQFAGLFAIAVAQNGGPLGQANELIYHDANVAYASDFHDVTAGNNGAFQAGPYWDHPTGWGSPNVRNFLSHLGIVGPRGTLAGTVTAAASGSAIAGAIVEATGPGTSPMVYQAVTGKDGSYSEVLPVGSFAVQVKSYGFAGGNTSVSINDGGTTTKDFALTAAPTVTLHGKVTDGSGHGYGLLANVTVKAKDFSQVSEAWTDPKDGSYSVELPKGLSYTINVASAVNGYNTASKDVTLTSDSTEDFPLTITAACTAPGYHMTGFSEDFNGGDFPPTGWTITNPVDGNVAWMLASKLPMDTDNFTGGTGDAASADSHALNSATDDPPYDTSLVTPPIAVSALGGATTLTYKANFITLGHDTFDLDISTDGGSSWTNVLHWTTIHGTPLGTPGVDVQQDLASYLPASGSFQLRWRFYGPQGWGGYGQIDDAVLGGCAPLAGGLVYGGVTDADTGAALTGATVSDDTGAGTTTIANNFDPALPASLYLYFAEEGARTLTARKRPYSPATANLSIANNSVTEQDFALKSARLAADPAAVNVHVIAGSSGTSSFALSNSGDGAGLFRIISVDAPAPPTANGQARSVAFVPMSRNAIDDLISGKAFAGGQYLGQAFAPRVLPRVGDAWQAIADYPLVVAENFGARDPATGKLYVMGGAGPQGPTTSGFVYDPAADSWSPMADLPGARALAAAVFLDGKLYVAGGMNLSAGGVPVQTLNIYDPASDSWTTGASDPVGQGAAAGYAVLDNKLYLVGGCGPLQTCATGGGLTAVEVYDPATDSWSAAADYPEPSSGTSCGGIRGKLYCSGELYPDLGTSGYVYDPATDAWSPIPNMPIPQAGAYYTAANGLLVVAGGFTAVNGQPGVTSAVNAYDPLIDSWTALTPMSTPIAIGAHTCGLYQVAGSLVAVGVSALSASASVLPGYDQDCVGGHPGIPWLAIAPTQGTVAPGAAARIELTFDGSKQAEFTSSEGYLMIVGAPDKVIVPVTVHWDPPVVNLDVVGSVSPTGPVSTGNALAYSITVQNLADAEGAATQVQLTYQIPDGVNYLASNGAQCTLPAPGSAAGAIPAAVSGPATVVCDLGTIAPNTGKLVNISVQATADADTVTGTFTASAREPDSDGSNNSLTLATNPAVGPPGPTGPEGPKGDKGDKGSGGLGWLALAALLGLALGGVVIRERRKQA